MAWRRTCVLGVDARRALVAGEDALCADESACRPGEAFSRYLPTLDA